jgi:hypothetical protein
MRVQRGDLKSTNSATTTTPADRAGKQGADFAGIFWRAVPNKTANTYAIEIKW